MSPYSIQLSHACVWSFRCQGLTPLGCNNCCLLDRHTSALSCRSIIPEAEPTNSLYANSNTMSAPQLSSSTTQTSPAENDSVLDRAPQSAGVLQSQTIPEVDSSSDLTTPVDPDARLNSLQAKSTKVGRFSIGPVKEPSGTGILKLLQVVFLVMNSTCCIISLTACVANQLVS